MKANKRLMRVVSAVIIPCFLGACTAYNRIEIPKEGTLPVREKTVILHRGNDTFYLYGVKITDEELRATVEKTRLGPRVTRDRELHIYVSPAAEIPESLPASASIPFAAIDKVVVYDVSTGNTVFVNVLAGVGIALGVLIVAILIIAALKSSCPFVYVFDGERYEFAGEIFSGATHPPIERHDYLPLPTLRAVDGEYRLKLANEVPEIQHTNLAELWVIDHPLGAEVLVDKHGVPHTLTELRSPAEAVTLRGEAVGDIISAADGSIYVGEVGEKADRDVEEMVLTFERPPEATEAKLVFQGKNSFWLDYVYGQFAELFGDAYADWFEDQKEAPPEEILQWTLEQGIFLAVYLQEGGEWRFTSEEVKVKLEFGPLFWEIDYVGLDFSAVTPVRVHRIPLTSAVNEKGEEVTALLRADDDLYYVQPNIGERAVLTFSVPEPAEGWDRSTVLHSKGHY
jgi:hypothetical protein